MKPEKNITILAIETSCDDTGIAIVKAGKNGSFKVLSNIVSSQVEVHKKWGGVYPMMAKREHQKNIVPVLKEALKKSKMLKNSKPRTLKLELKTLKSILEREKDLQKPLINFLQKHQKPNINLIAVTNGPGLEPCLWVGVNFAKALANTWKLPIVTVNHLKAHIFVNTGLTKKNLPAVCLIASGGHTLLFLMKDFGKYKILGETRDDAAGECFDKAARILGLKYPGGPEISKKAAEFTGKRTIKLPRPMINTKDYDFSFSGLKTAVLYNALKKKKRNKKYIQEMCKEVQQAIIDVLIKKTMDAAINKKAKAIILGGGVTANKELRRQLQERAKKLIPKTKLFFPKPENCTDNAFMTAIAGYFRYKSGEKENRISLSTPRNCSGLNWKKIKVNANLKIRTCLRAEP